jgi:hypothetical protein
MPTRAAPEPEFDPTDPFDEVHRLVKEAISAAEPGYHTSRLAVSVREHLQMEHPGLWDVWTSQIGLDQLKVLIARERGVQRRGTSGRGVRGFDITEEVDSSHTIRRVGDMVRSDLDYVARRYSRLATTLKHKAQAIRALYDRMPDETALVREVLTEEEIEKAFKPGSSSD